MRALAVLTGLLSLALILVVALAVGASATWIGGPPQPSPRGTFGVAATNDTIYLVGGLQGGVDTAAVRRFSAGAYSNAALLPKSMRQMAVAIQGDSIWVVGGKSGTNIETGVYVYHIPTNTWYSNYPGYPTPIHAAAAVILGDTLYVIGGDPTYAVAGETNLVYALNVKNPTTWQARSILSGVRAGLVAMVSPNDTSKIYVFGGYDGLDEVNLAYVYNDTANTWSALANMPRKLSDAAFAVRGDTLFLIGGFGGAGLDTKSVISYNRVSATYTQEPSLPQHSSHGAAGILGDTMFMFAGMAGNGITDVDTVWTLALPPLPPPAGGPKTWYVNDTSTTGDGFATATGADTQQGDLAGSPFRTLIKALKMAMAGDTIKIDAGVYDSYTIVNGDTVSILIDTDNIAIIGKDSSAVIINPRGPAGQSGVYGIYADTQTGITIKDLAIIGGFQGIRFVNVDLSTISGDSVVSCGDAGIALTNGSDTVTVSDNISNLNVTGIWINGGTNNRIDRNKASSNTNFGIYVDASSNNAVLGNATRSNGIDGIYVANGSTSNMITKNVVKANTRKGISIDGSNANAIILNEIGGSDSGLVFWGSAANNLASRNNITGNNVNNLYNNSMNPQTVTRNWWGTTNEVVIVSKINDTANAFKPFRLGAVDTAPNADTTAPEKPTGVTLDTSVTGQIKITWVKPNINEETNGGVVGLKDFFIYRLAGVPDTANWHMHEIATVVAGTGQDTQYIDTGVNTGVTYYYRITAVDSAMPFENESFFTDTVSILRDTPLPPLAKALFVNDNSTAGDSFTSATGSDTGGSGADTSPYLTIMKALSMAKAGDTIVIDAGTYSETVVVDTDGVTLVGKDSNATKIDPPGGTSSSNAVGIKSTNRKSIHIRHLAVVDAYNGVYFDNVDNGRIVGDSFTGIGFEAIILTNNADTNTVRKNFMDSCGGSGIKLMGSSVSNLVDSNIIERCLQDAIYILSGPNTFVANVITAPPFNGIQIQTASNVSLIGNTIKNGNSRGIYLNGSTNGTVRLNRLDSNALSGIEVFTNANNNLIDKNTIIGNSPHGIVINTATDNIVENNDIDSNAQDGINLSSASTYRTYVRNNRIRFNTIAGIELNSAETNIITQNLITGNDTGVWFTGATPSAYNVITKNNLQDNRTGEVRNIGGSTATLTRNWWGVTDEIAIKNKVSDTYNTFHPYRLSSVDTVPGTDTTAPDKVVLTLDTTVASQIKLTWVIPTINEESNGGAVGFNGLNIYRLLNQPDTNNWHNAVLVKQTISTESTWIDTGVAGGNTYYYRATSKDAAGVFNESFFSDTKWTAPTGAGNPAAVLQILELSDVLAPDLVPGETMILRVIDTGANTNSALAETFTIRMRNLVTGEQETPLLTEIDTNNAIFEAKFRFSGNSADNGHNSGRMYITPSETVQFDYTDPTDATDTKQKILKIIAVLDGGPIPTDTQIAQGDTAAILAWKAVNELPKDNASQTDTVTNIRVTFVSVLDTYVKPSGAKLWLDTGILGKFDAAVDALLTSATVANGVCTFPVSGPNTVFAPGDTRHFLVTIEIIDTVAVNEALDAKILKGDITHVLGGQVPDSDLNSAGLLTVTTSKPNVLMSISQDTILAPASYNGPSADTVPGATMTLILKYDNDGGETAVNFTLSAKIPQNSKLGTGADSPGAIGMTSAHTGATVTVAITDDSGIAVPETHPNAVRLKWTFTTGVAPNNGDPSGIVDANAADADAGILKYKVYIK